MFYQYKVGARVMSPGPDGVAAAGSVLVAQKPAAYSTEALVRRAVEC